MASASFKNGSLIESFTSTATSAGTRTLVFSDDKYQVFTGTASHTMVMPSATTMILNQAFEVVNTSTGEIAVQANGGGALGTVPAGSSRLFRVTDISSSAGVWDVAAASGGGSGGLSIAESSQFSALTAKGFSAQSRVLKFNPEEIGGNFWTSKASLPLAKQSSIAFPLNGYVYNSVGLAGAVSNTTYRYSDDYNFWLSRANANTAREEMPGHFVLNGKGYFGGGFNASNLASVEKYDDVLNTWTTVASLNTARIRTPGAALGGFGYVFSGVTSPSTTVVNTNEIYNDIANTWVSRGTGMSAPKGGAGRFEIDDTIYICGGYINGGSVSASQTTVESYNYLINSFKSESAITVAKSYMAGGASIGVGILAGGTNGSDLSSVSIFNSASKAFIAAPTISSARATMPGTSMNGVFYSIGGNGGPVATVESYASSSFLSIGSLNKSAAIPISISVAVILNALTPNVPVQLRTDGDSWKNFMSAGNALKLSETLSTKFKETGLNYTAGGDNASGTYYAINEFFDDNTNAWYSRLSIAAGNRTGTFGFKANGFGYLASGFSGSYESTNLQYDEIKNTWLTKSGVVATAKANGIAFVIEGAAFIASGGNGGGVTNNNQKYAIETDTWTTVTALTTARAYTTGWELLGRGYVVNGSTTGSFGDFLASVERYDAVLNAWTTVTSVANGRTGPQGYAIDGFGYYAGGYNNAFANPGSEKYDPTANSWSIITSMTNGRCLGGSNRSNGYGFVVAGFTNPVYAAVERFTPNANIWTVRTSVGTARQGPSTGFAPSPYRNYEIRVGVPALYAGIGSIVWTTMANMITAQSAGVSGLLQSGDIVNFGSSATQKYNKEANAWSLFKSYTDVSGTTYVPPSGFTLGGVVYGVSGALSAATSTTSVYYFREGLNTWTATGSISVGRVRTLQSNSGVLNGFGYITGGSNANPNNTNYPSTERYNQSLGTWSTVASTNETASVNYKLGFTAGGFWYTGKGISVLGGSGVATVERYNDAANTYTTLSASYAFNGEGTSGGTFNGTAMGIGGYESNNTTLSSQTYSFNPSSEVFTRSVNIPTATASPSHTDNLVIGGYNGAASSSVYKNVDSVKQAILSAGLMVS